MLLNLLALILPVVMLVTSGVAAHYLTMKRLVAQRRKAELEAKAVASANETADWLSPPAWTTAQTAVPATGVTESHGPARNAGPTSGSEARTGPGPTIAEALQQPEFGWSLQYFYGIAFILSILTGGSVYLAFANIKAAIIIGIAAGLLLASLIVAYVRNRRLRIFSNELPDVIDIIVRGVADGIPLTECMTAVVTESTGPVRSEFKAVLRRTAQGQSLSEAITGMVERISLPETRYLAAAFALQQKAEGGLTETLTILAKTLRDRQKIQAISETLNREAKLITFLMIGAPLAVLIFNSIYNFEFYDMLFSFYGKILLSVCILWMSLGIFVIRTLIRFEV